MEVFFGQFLALLKTFQGLYANVFRFSTSLKTQHANFHISMIQTLFLKKPGILFCTVGSLIMGMYIINMYEKKNIFLD